MLRVIPKSPEWEIQPRRHGLRWNDRIKMELKEGGYDGLEWIHVVQYLEQRQRRVLGNRLMNLRTESVRVPPFSSQTPCGPLQVLLYILHTMFVIQNRLFAIIFFLTCSGYSEPPGNFYGTYYVHVHSSSRTHASGTVVSPRTVY